MKLKKMISTSLLLFGLISFGNGVDNMKIVNKVEKEQAWDKIFPKSDKVDHYKVTFKNRYGITLSGDLYVPKNIMGKKLEAIAVSGPFGAVKEQSSGIYAQSLAERGFVTLAFDASYTGESSGEPRNFSSPEVQTEDFSAAVDYLGLLDFVDREKIGILGICGGGGMALNAASMDTRISAVATVVMYDISSQTRYGYDFARYSDEDRLNMKKQMNAQRWIDAENGETALQEGGLPKVGSDDYNNSPQFIQEYADFYVTERGFHERSVNSNSGWTKTMGLSYLNSPLLTYGNEISIPVLIIAGEKAHSLFHSREAFEKIGSENKELYIVQGATHVDLYDNVKGIAPFDKLSEFFKTNLK